jgi:hypothetical protein
LTRTGENECEDADDGDDNVAVAAVVAVLQEKLCPPLLP